MNIAILIVSSASLLCSAGCLCIMARTARDLRATKAQVETEVEDFKNKTDRNIRRIRSTLEDLEM